MFTNAEFKDFMQEHETEILNNDWESIYDDLPSYKDVPKLTDFLLNKVHINPLFYMTAVPGYFAYNLDILSINIPNNVTSIGSAAFSDCRSLTTINIPNNVTSIGSAAFSGCSKLTSITIPNSVTEIGGAAFSNCNSLKSITIPNSVRSIGGYAFYACIGLTSITIPSSVKRIGDGAFGGCIKLKEINYTGTQRQWDKLLSLAKSRDFAKWVHENKVKIIFI